MRISDWSSDVCSSDLVRNGMPALAAAVDNLFAQVRSNLDNVHFMALYDPVTALPNRIHFKREADRLLKARGPGERVALLFIDLDGFKEVNDNQIGRASCRERVCQYV